MKKILVILVSKGKNRYDSISYPQSGFSIDGNMIWLSKIGDIKFKLHRPIEGCVKRLTIRRSSTKKWYVSFLIEEPKTTFWNPLMRSSAMDMGILNFAVLSNGELWRILDFFLLMKNDSRRLKANVISYPKDRLREGRQAKL